MIDPVAFTIGPFTVRWYGIFVAVGLIAGFNLQLWRAKKYDFTGSGLGYHLRPEAGGRPRFSTSFGSGSGR